jgi:hypothetical protein
MKIGDRVILLPHRWAPASNNPYWGWQDRYIKGTLYSVNNNNFQVDWDNGTHNCYNNGDLMVYSKRNALWVKMMTHMRDIYNIQQDIGTSL